MNKLSAIFLVFASVCHATSIDRREVHATPENLSQLGISVGIHPEPLCAEASDIEISAPALHNGAKFSGATLEIREKSNLLLSTSLELFEADETLYSAQRFHGVSFCLHPSLFGSAVVRIFYSKGELTTDSILIGELGVYASQ